MIDVCGVSKRYGGVHALAEVSLRAERGTVLGLLGQNGAGKTTLLNIMTGYLAPTEGRVLIDGSDPLLSPDEAKRHLGYLPEHPPLYDEMTVYEYLRFVSLLKGVNRKAVRTHIEELMEQTGLTEMRNRLLAHLSKGYRQRAGMAQALCGGPEVLVLDEPTVGLDPKQITEIRALMRTLSKGRTIVFSSHMLGEVQQLCDRVVILHQGRVKLDAPVSRKEGGGVTLLCTIGAGQRRLLPALNGLTGVTRVSVQAQSQTDETTVLIEFENQPEPERALFTLVSGLGFPILKLNRCEDSLEQVFLKAIAE